MTLGDYIKEYRNAHKCSMEDFAKRAGMSKAYVSILERNYNPSTGKAAIPSLETIKRVAAATAIDFNELISMLDENQEVLLVDKGTSFSEDCSSYSKKRTGFIFYYRFKKLCDRKGITCSKAASEIGISSTTPARWEKTGVTPPKDVLKKIAEYFNVSIDYLLLGDEENRDIYEFSNTFREIVRQKPNLTFAERVKLLFDISLFDLKEFSYWIDVPWHEIKDWMHGETKEIPYLTRFLGFWGLRRNEIFNKTELAELRESVKYKNGDYLDNKDILDEVDVAFYGEYKELSDDDKEIVRNMVRVMRERRSQAQGK